MEGAWRGGADGRRRFDKIPRIHGGHAGGSRFHARPPAHQPGFLIESITGHRNEPGSIKDW